MKWELDLPSPIILNPHTFSTDFHLVYRLLSGLHKVFKTSIQERLTDEHASEVFRYFLKCFVANGK